MDSSKIIEEFLLSKSSLNDIVSFEKFRKLFDKKIPEEELQDLFDCLGKQREAVVNKSREVTRRTLSQSLDRLIKYLQLSRDEYVDERSVKSVTGKLGEANKLFQTTSTQLDQEIEAVLLQIKGICERVEDVDYEEALAPLCNNDGNKESEYIVERIKKFRDLLEKEGHVD